MNVILINKRIKINEYWTIEIRDDYTRSDINWISGYLMGKWFNDSFIKYDKNIKNGKIAYDRPEVIPAYVKDRLRRELNRLIPEIKQ